LPSTVEHTIKRDEDIHVIGRGPSTDLAVLKIDVPDLPTAENSRGSRVDRYLRLDLTLYPGSSGAAFAGATGLVLGLATSALSRVAPIPIPACCSRATFPAAIWSWACNRSRCRTPRPGGSGVRKPPPRSSSPSNRTVRPTAPTS
jgi:hypothetical protein